MMAKNAKLFIALLCSSVVLSGLITGCQGLSSDQPVQPTEQTQDQTATNQNPQSLKREQAIRLARELDLPAQIALAGLGRHSPGPTNLKLSNANCGAWKEELSGVLTANKARQAILHNDEVKISLSALQLVASGQFIMDIPELVLGVTHNIAVFPIELYDDVKKLETVHTQDKASLQSLRQELLNNINAVKNNRRSCKLSITRYLKSKIGLIERRCTPKISASAIDKLRDLAVSQLVFNTANEIVKNDTTWRAAQIYALIHGWTITDDTRVALEKALSENPDIGPLVDSGVDALLKKENADTVLTFLGKIKEANKTCGPKEPIRLNDHAVASLP